MRFLVYFQKSSKNLIFSNIIMKIIADEYSKNVENVLVTITNTFEICFLMGINFYLYNLSKKMALFQLLLLAYLIH